jgi:signal transduction histidine kinase
MNATYITTILIACSAVAYLVIALVVWRRRGLEDTVIRYLVIFAFGGFLVEGCVALLHPGWLIAYELVRWVPAYGAALLLWLFLALSDEFLNRQIHIWWMGISGIWLGILLVLWLSGYLPDSALPMPESYPTLLVINMLTALVFTLRVVFLTLIAFFQSRQSLYKNRLIYWGLATVLLAVGDSLIFAEHHIAGRVLCMLGGLAITYAVWSYHQANLAQVTVKLIGYALLGGWSALLYIAGSYGAQALLGPAEPSMLTSMALAITIAIMASPVLAFIHARLRQRAFGEGYDTSQVVRDYSLGITNIVDVKRLSQTSLQQVAKVFDASRGYFFLVDQEHIDENLFYWLRPLAKLEDRERSSGRLRAANPLVQRFLREHQPVMQYDIEVLPEFKEMEEGELSWLSDLNLDVYIPICAPEKWLGLLALGPKPGNSQYNTQDLLLLTTLAEQTVVALENARLVADLEEANTNLQTAFLQLERANSDLKELDELKSSFIGVVSHEMRTPLANVGFSLQIFERHGLDSLKPGQVEEFQELRNSFQLATLMTENLVLLASFLNKQVAAQLEPLEMRQILQGVLPPFIAKAQKKEVQMKLDIIGELPPFYADRKLLSNAIYQLVHNALKFTDSGGKVWVTCWATSNTICVDVKDTGKGIPADRLQEMWREFKQMADPLKRGLEGLGLGLALVRHIIALHGGEVWAESTPGQGSAFGFQVPIAGPKQANSPKEIFRRRVVAGSN